MCVIERVFPRPVLLTALVLAVPVAAGCGAGSPEPAGPRPVAEAPGDDPASSALSGIDLDQVESVCADIQSDIDTVDTAAEALEQDLLVDRVPYQDQHFTELEDHLFDVERLEEIFSGTGLGDEFTDRADAVSSVLDELETGDEAGLAEALALVEDTRGPLLEFCEL